MSHKPLKQDSWSSLLSELGVDDPTQQVEVSEPSPEQYSASEPLSPGKAGKFGSGIVPERPPLPGAPKKPGKMSFFDRLASISLFGAGAPEKIDPKVITPTNPEMSGLAEEISKPKKLPKVEKTPKEPKKENRPQIGAVDPWSKIATQLGVQAANTEPEQPQQEYPEEQEEQEETRPVAEPVDEIPDIELMTSFRDLPSKKTKIAPPAPVARSSAEQVERAESVSEPVQSRASLDFPRKDRQNRRPSREERRSDQSDKYTSSNQYTANPRGQRREKPKWSEYEYKEIPERDVDDVDLVNSPLPNDRVNDERTVLPGKPSRNPRSRSPKYEKTDRRPRRDYTGSQEEDFVETFEENLADDYEVLTPPPEREYGPPRDVFADLFPGEAGSGEKPEESRSVVRRSGSESGHLTRGSKTRGTSFQEESSAEFVEETDPFAHFNKKAGRGSHTERSRRVEKAAESDDNVSFEEDMDSSSPRRRGARGRSAFPKGRAVAEEPMDEQEREMIQLHRNIPGWEDAILPIIESNIAKHANRSGGGRKGGRSKP